MRTTALRRAALAAGLALLAVPAASAGTLHVKPGQSIQTALDQAHAGDTVLVASGVYTETLAVRQDQVGLTLQGQGQVVLDARPDAPDGSGTGISIYAFDVVVRNFTIVRPRSGSTPAGHDKNGYGVWIGNKGVTLEDVVVLGCSTWGVRATADDVTLEDVEVRGAASGVRVDGNGLRADRVAVFGAESDAFRSSGDDTEIVRGSFESQFGVAVTLSGNQVLLERSTLKGGYGVLGGGSEIVVQRCRISATSSAVEISGEHLVLERNVVESAGQFGLSVSGTDLQIVRNRIDAPSAQQGLRVSGEHGSVSDNVVGPVMQTGLFVAGNDLEVDGNRLGGATSNHGIGIDVQGSNHVLEKNLVRGTTLVGIAVRSASDVELTQNKVERGAGTGIGIASSCSQTRLTGNKVRQHLGEGIQNWGKNTALAKNTSLDNLRGNLTNASAGGATLVDLGGNVLGKGVSSPASAPEPTLYDWL